MDAIKKKMQAMKLEKEGAADKADQLEQSLSEQKELNAKVSQSYPPWEKCWFSTHPCATPSKIAPVFFLHILENSINPQIYIIFRFSLQNMIEI